MNKLVLHTAAGAMDVISLSEFTKRISLEIVQSNQVNIPIVESSNYAVKFNSYLLPNTTITSNIYKLDKISRIDVPFISSERITHTPTKEFIYKESIDKGISNIIIDDFRILVAKKDPEFFLKDLSVEALQNLANKYAMNFGSQDFQGIHIELSQYQKFFMIASNEDFKFYYNQSITHAVDRDATRIDIKGKLVNLRPDKIVLGRYEFLTYPVELASQRRFTIV